MYTFLIGCNLWLKYSLTCGACMCPKCMGAKGPCKVEIIPDIQKNWMKLTLISHPPLYQFFLWKLIIIKDCNFGGVSQFFIFYPKWPWTHPPTYNFFWLFGIFFNFATSLSLYHTCNKINPRLYIYRNYADP